MATPVIIEAAINGATSKRRNPNVPISTDELIADALACLDAGAAIIHFHIASSGPVRRRRGGCATWRWLEPVLAARPDALWYPTINFGPPALRYAHIAPLASSGLTADDAERSGFGQPRLGPRRRAARLVRLRQLVRRHRRADAPWPRAWTRPEHRRVRARLPARRRRLPTCRPAPRGCVRQAVHGRRPWPERVPVRPAADDQGARRLSRAVRGHRPGVGGVRRRRRPSSNTGVRGCPRASADTCTSVWSSTAGRGRRRTCRW